MMNKFLLLFAFLGLMLTATANAELPNDQHVQSDRLASPLNNAFDGNNVVNAAHLGFFRSLLKDDYPVRSIYLNASAQQGINISDTAYLLTLLQPQRGREFYSVAIDLLPSLPGWACGTDPDLDIRYPIYFEADTIGSSPSVIEVARRFFEQSTQIGFSGQATDPLAFPDPNKKEFHFTANIDELIELASSEIEETGADNWWYQTGDKNVEPGEDGMPVHISLYKYDRSLVVDATKEQLEKLKSAGSTTLPVIMVYNGSYSLPVSRECKNVLDSQGNTVYEVIPSDQLTVENVSTSYFDCRRRVTPPREWHRGDYHIMASLEEINKTFDYPSRTAIAPAKWDRMQADLSENGFFPPMLITLFLDDQQMWAKDLEKAAVAASMGMEKIPVVFLFHEINRHECTSIPNCGHSICRAVVSGGADFQVSECSQVYQDWLQGVMPVSQEATSDPEATMSDEQKAIIDILKKAAEQVK